MAELCNSKLSIVDREARAELRCGEPPLHESDHESSTTGVRWPRLEQGWGTPILTPAPGDLARRFHEAYERLAPSFGYETRRDSAVPWEQVPEQNRALMTAVCAELFGAAPGTDSSGQAVQRDECPHNEDRESCAVGCAAVAGPQRDHREGA